MPDDVPSLGAVANGNATAAHSFWGDRSSSVARFLRRWWRLGLIAAVPLLVLFLLLAEFGVVAIDQGASSTAQVGSAATAVAGAVLLVDRIPTELPAQQKSDSVAIESSLGQLSQSFGTNTASVSSGIARGSAPSQSDLRADERRDAGLLEQLMEIHLGAPPDAQASTAQAIAALQTNLATVLDALGKAPVSPVDGAQLAQFVGEGFLTSGQLTTLLTGSTSNRMLLDNLTQLVQSGQLPDEALYAVGYDVLQQFDPNGVARFVASVDFDELGRIAIFTKVVVPSALEQRAITRYLASYRTGEQLPIGSDRSFVAPLIYGLELAPRLAADLRNINPDDLSPVQRVLYQAWLPLASSRVSDPKKLFTQMLALSNASVERDADLLRRVQLEVLSTAHSNVAYLVLPPGWTQSMVTQLQGTFQQSIADLESLDTVQSTTQSALQKLSAASAVLSSVVPQKSVDSVRQIVAATVGKLQRDLVMSANTTKSPSKVAPNLKTSLHTLQRRFDGLMTKVTTEKGSIAGAPATAEITGLRSEVASALDDLAAAKVDLQSYVQANAAMATSFQAPVLAVQTAQQQSITELQQRISQLTGASGAVTSQLTSDVHGMQQSFTSSLANVSGQLAAANSATTTVQTKLDLTTLAQSNQIADLQAQLHLSEAARAGLEAQVAASVAQLKSDQAATVAALQKKIDDSAALRAQLDDATRTQLSDLTAKQATLLSSVQSQATNHLALSAVVASSLTALDTAQQRTQLEVANLASSGTSLVNQLSVVQGTLAQAQSAIQQNTNDTSQIRSDLQQTVTTLQTSQTAAVDQLNGAVGALGDQLRQSISTLNSAQSQTNLTVASLTNNVAQTQSAVSDIQGIQTQTQIALQAQASANLALGQTLTASLAPLQAAQLATQSALSSLGTNVDQLKTSVATIAASQQQAQAQIDGLLTVAANWTSIPATLQFNQAQFAAFEQQLQSEFAAASASLQSQFGTYQQQLGADIQGLHSDVNSQLNQLKAEQALLKSQLDQLAQAGLSTTSSTAITTPTTTPISVSTTTSSLPVTTTSLPVTTTTLPTATLPATTLPTTSTTLHVTVPGV